MIQISHYMYKIPNISKKRSPIRMSVKPKTKGNHRQPKARRTLQVTATTTVYYGIRVT